MTIHELHELRGTLRETLAKTRRSVTHGTARLTVCSTVGNTDNFEEAIGNLRFFVDRLERLRTEYDEVNCKIINHHGDIL